MSLPSLDSSSPLVLGVVIGAVLTKTLDGLAYLFQRRQRLADERAAAQRQLLINAQVALEELRLWGGATLAVPSLGRTFRALLSGPMADDGVRFAVSALVRLETVTEAVRDTEVRRLLSTVTQRSRSAFEAEGTAQLLECWREVIDAANAARVAMGQLLREDGPSPTVRFLRHVGQGSPRAPSAGKS